MSPDGTGGPAPGTARVTVHAEHDYDVVIGRDLLPHVAALVGPRAGRVLVVHPDHGSEAATLLQRGDLATTAAKTVPGSIQLYNPGLESRSMRRL